jgi:hypothetical protein
MAPTPGMLGDSAWSVDFGGTLKIVAGSLCSSPIQADTRGLRWPGRASL